jgi:5-methylcytosine-specific restriction endonuclease McrA
MITTNIKNGIKQTTITRTIVKRKDNRSYKAIKQELYENQEYSCNCCYSELPLKRLELDHIIPISIKPESHNNDNYQLLCKKCHLKKTQIDKLIINLLTKTKILIRLDLNTTTTYVEREKIEEIHNRITHLIDVAKGSEQLYWLED